MAFNFITLLFGDTTPSAQGDLIVGKADDTVTRLPVGPDGYVLTVDGATTAGLAYRAPGTAALADGSVTDPKVAPGISADKLVDGVANRVFTTADDVKLTGIAPGATVNATDAQLRDRATHTGLQSADSIVDGAANKVYTAAEKTKLGGVAAGATVNATDAQLRDRATHIGTQPISTVVGLQAALDALLVSVTRTGAYTLALADVGVEQVYSSATAGTFTVPTNAAAGVAVGASVPLRQTGAGQLTVVGAAGVTVNSRGAALKLAGQYAVAELRKVATDTWALYGDVTV